MPGKLVLVGTPIGNLEDASRRAIRTLEEAEVLACEDTRRTRKLLSHYGIRVRELVTYHEGNERRSARGLLERLKRGQDVVLVSDAGMPGLSDPGFRLVEACARSGIEVEVVPGPTASVSALALSGLPPARFVFEGFLPRKASERRRHIGGLLAEERTIVLFESPHRIADTLADLLDALGDRPAVVARELTKLHETVHRGTLSSLLDQARANEFIGEIVVVISGAVREARTEVGPEQLAARAQSLIDGGMDRKQAMTTVAQEAGVSKRQVFDALVELKRDAK
ncbi:MAG: 16S rRNA (cytidine(1402)-2'-O)-methyltransferase [Actinomycetota bacterium]